MSSNPPLEILVNGLPKAFPPEAFPGSLHDLVLELGLAPDHVVAEVNGVLVKRAEMETRTVSAGDRVELVRFVGGG